MTLDTKKSSIKFVGAGIAAIVIVAILFVPMVPISAQEQYQDVEKKQESYVDIETRTEQYTDIETRTEAYTAVEYRNEAYTDVEYTQESYTELEEKSETLNSIEDRTLEGGEWQGWSSYIEAGRNVELIVSASDTIETYVVSNSDYTDNGNSYGSPVSTQANVRYGFVAPLSDTYYFTFRNPHNGFFDNKNVGLYSAEATMTWDEQVTKYKDVQVPVTKYKSVEVPVTKYKDVQVPVTKTRDIQVPVTKYKDIDVPVTKTRTIEKTVSIIELMQNR